MIDRSDALQPEFSQTKAELFVHIHNKLKFESFAQLYNCASQIQSEFFISHGPGILKRVFHFMFPHSMGTCFSYCSPCFFCSPVPDVISQSRSDRWQLPFKGDIPQSQTHLLWGVKKKRHSIAPLRKCLLSERPRNGAAPLAFHRKGKAQTFFLLKQLSFLPCCPAVTTETGALTTRSKHLPFSILLLHFSTSPSGTLWIF